MTTIDSPKGRTMVKCGNCNQSHSSARAVRQCYVDEGKTLQPHERPMSSKQGDYIDTLLDILEERPVSDEVAEGIQAIVVHFHSTFPEPTSGQASNFIEVLNGLRWLVPPAEKQEETEQEEIEFTEAEKLAASESAPDTTEGLCPRCGAAGDEVCTTKSGNEASVPHAGRYTKAS